MENSAFTAEAMGCDPATWAYVREDGEIDDAKTFKVRGRVINSYLDTTAGDGYLVRAIKRGPGGTRGASTKEVFPTLMSDEHQLWLNNGMVLDPGSAPVGTQLELQEAFSANPPHPDALVYTNRTIALFNAGGSLRDNEYDDEEEGEY